MDKNITVSGFAKYRLERAKQDLSDAEFSYKHKRYLNANNRAYYSIFHAIKAVLALERVDFKRHKGMCQVKVGNFLSFAYFNFTLAKRLIVTNSMF